MKFTVKTETKDSKYPEHDGYIINSIEIDRLIGSILTLIETLGLPDKQEKPLKDLIKQTIRNNIGTHSNTIITKEIYDVVCAFNSNLHNEIIRTDLEVPDEVGACLRDGKYELTFTSKY